MRYKAEHGSVWKGIAAGALGGLVAAFAMNQFQALLKAARKAASDGKEQQSDEESSESSEDATTKTAEILARTLCDCELSEEDKKWAGPAVHYTYGTLMGALYGGLSEALPELQVGRGTAFGAALWLGGDEIAVPALGLSGPASETPLSTHVSALAAHLVYGIVTDSINRAAAAD